MKKILLTLLIWIIWLIWFWYCWTITTHFKWQTITHDWSNSNVRFACTNVLTTASNDVQSSFSVTYSFDSFSISSNTTLYCATYSQYNWTMWNISSMWISNKFSENLTHTFTKTTNTKWVAYCCLQVNWYNLTSITYWDYSVTFDTNNVPAPDCPSQYTSEECQQEYSLMPISSCNSEYCWLNWLCSEYTWNLSELYINGISHMSAPMINITIPFDIPRDYNLTWNIFDLKVLWNSGDQEYIEWLINVNSYRPTSEDFTQTFVWWLTLIFPYIIITAMILFLWRFIKKIFK